jgi:hypothetical protein
VRLFASARALRGSGAHSPNRNASSLEQSAAHVAGRDRASGPDGSSSHPYSMDRPTNNGEREMAGREGGSEDGDDRSPRSLGSASGPRRDADLDGSCDESERSGAVARRCTRCARIGGPRVLFACAPHGTRLPPSMKALRSAARATCSTADEDPATWSKAAESFLSPVSLLAPPKRQGVFLKTKFLSGAFREASSNAFDAQLRRRRRHD